MDISTDAKAGQYSVCRFEFLRRPQRCKQSVKSLAAAHNIARHNRAIELVHSKVPVQASELYNEVAKLVFRVFGNAQQFNGESKVLVSFLLAES